MLVAAAVCAIGGLSFGLSAARAIAPIAIGILATAGWLTAKGTVASGRALERPRLALCTMAVALVAIVITTGTWTAANPRLYYWIASRTPPSLAGSGPEQLVLLASLLLFLTAPANSVVRAVLTAAGTEWRGTESTLRGGRIIGVLERWLIFGLAVAGEPTAAALIVSAKSLLRFPELSSAGERETESTARIDVLTEYFLLGSLTSWTLALAAAALL